MKNTWRDRYLIYALPALVFFIVLVIVPALGTLIFSFSEWQGFAPRSFGTTKHYQRLFQDSVIVKALLNNLAYLLLTIVFEGMTGLVLAGIAYNLRGSSMLFRAVAFSPAILPSVVVGVLWRQIMATDGGLLNRIIGLAGAAPIAWFGSDITMISISVISGWIFCGYFMTIFYAGMMGIPTEVIEAARIDGLGKVGIFFRMLVPLVRNYSIAALVIITTGAFKGFELFVVTLRRDPLETGTVLSTYMVRTLIEGKDIGYSSALSILLVAITVIILIGFSLAGRGKDFSHD